MLEKYGKITAIGVSIIIVLSILIASGQYLYLENSGETYTIDGIIIHKYYEPSSTQIRSEYDFNLKMNTVKTYHIPAVWGISVEGERGMHTFDVYQETYNRLKIDDPVILKYMIGGKSGKHHFRGLAN